MFMKTALFNAKIGVSKVDELNEDIRIRIYLENLPHWAKWRPDEKKFQTTTKVKLWLAQIVKRIYVT